MSIIERVAQLLEPIVPATPEPSAARKAPTAAELDLIERAIDQSSERSWGKEARVLPIPAAGSGAERTSDATPKATEHSRTVAVNLARLRQQGIIAPGGDRSATAESFRRIKRRILANAANAKGNAPTNLVLVTSALPGEGKTFCSINLAISIASEVDHSVLLVDADVRKPSIPAALGLKAEKGLMDLLLDRRMDMAKILYRTDIGKLTLLPAGTAQQRSTELLASGAMQELLREMAARYRDRIIIFDTPPLLAATEASVLAGQVGQVVMVVESGKTTESALKEALGHIDASRLAGLVLNKGEGQALGYYYGGYGQSP